MKAHNTIVVAIIGVFALVSAPSQASEILTCKYAGWLEVVTSENKDRLEKEGFVPVPNDPQVMFKSQLLPKSFQVATDRMRWVGEHYEWRTTTARGDDLIVEFDSKLSEFRGWNPTYMAELDREIATWGPCWRQYIRQL